MILMGIYIYILSMIFRFFLGDSDLSMLPLGLGCPGGQADRTGGPGVRGPLYGLRDSDLGSIVDEVRYEHWGPWGHCHVIVILYILCIYYVYVYIYMILNKLHMFNIMTIMTPMVNTIYIYIRY